MRRYVPVAMMLGRWASRKRHVPEAAASKDRHRQRALDRMAKALHTMAAVVEVHHDPALDIAESRPLVDQSASSLGPSCTPLAQKTPKQSQ
jgi:hypothetical protein